MDDGIQNFFHAGPDFPGVLFSDTDLDKTPVEVRMNKISWIEPYCNSEIFHSLGEVMPPHER
jgi:hypothetical protein